MHASPASRIRTSSDSARRAESAVQSQPCRFNCVESVLTLHAQIHLRTATRGVHTGVPHRHPVGPYRNRHPVGPYSRTMPSLLWWSYGGGRFLTSEVPLYPSCRMSGLCVGAEAQTLPTGPYPSSSSDKGPYPSSSSVLSLSSLELGDTHVYAP